MLLFDCYSLTSLLLFEILTFQYVKKFSMLPLKVTSLSLWWFAKSWIFERMASLSNEIFSTTVQQPVIARIIDWLNLPLHCHNECDHINSFLFFLNKPIASLSGSTAVPVCSHKSTRATDTFKRLSEWILVRLVIPFKHFGNQYQ